MIKVGVIRKKDIERTEKDGFQLMEPKFKAHATARIDEFNTFLGGKPQEITIDGRKVRISSLITPFIERTNRNSRSFEMVETKDICGRPRDFIIASVNDIFHCEPNSMVSGENGWMIVTDYTQIKKMVDVLRVNGGFDYEKSFCQCLDGLKNAENFSKYAEVWKMWTFHNRKSRSHDVIGDNDSDAFDIKDVLDSGENYKSGQYFKRLIEFIAHISPDETEWTLKNIGHPRTRQRLLAGTPFNETGFGQMFGLSGWEHFEKHGVNPKPISAGRHSTSPLVVKSRDLKIGPEWGDLKERLALADKRSR